jgi:hypothetical protein
VARLFFFLAQKRTAVAKAQKRTARPQGAVAKALCARRAHTADHRPPTTPRRSSGYCFVLTGCGSAGSPEHNPNRRLHYVLKKTAS